MHPSVLLCLVLKALGWSPVSDVYLKDTQVLPDTGHEYVYRLGVFGVLT